MGGHSQKEQAEIREELQRILVSPVFLHSERLRRFLTHCVEAALAGRVDDLKEYTIGVAAFDRPKLYNPAEDPIVRVEARRLRKKLDEYYLTHGSTDAVTIRLPKGGYLPAFDVRRAPEPQSRFRLRTAAAAAVVCCAAAGFWLFGERRVAVPEIALTRLTSGHGLTTDPALSADGSLLVYASDRASTGGLDIWLQSIGERGTASIPRQLTEDAADDSQPSLSPDGSSVAFRSERQPPGVYLVPASGGAAKLIAPDGRNPRYSPDGRWIAYWVGAPGGESLPPAGKVYVVRATGGSSRRLAGNFTSAACPVWSPTGDRILIEGIQSPSDSLDLWSVSLRDESAATGIGRMADQARLRLAVRECSLSWGRGSIVFSALDGDAQNLWRLPAKEDGRPAGRLVRLTFGSAEETVPFETPSGTVAFAGRTETLDVWRLKPESADAPTRVTEGVAVPTFPQVRRNRLVFLSRNEGRSAVWLKDLQTGDTRQLTRPGGEPGYPQLCPDGETVLFSDGPNTYAVTPRSDAPRLVCNGCSRIWQCTDRALLYVPAGSTTPVGVDEMLLPNGPQHALLISPGHDLANPQLSADGWLAFHSITGVMQRQIYVTRYRPGGAIPASEWIAVTDGLHMDRNAVWNERSDTLYFLSERCGFRCIWSQRLDPASKKAVGEPVAVRHFHSARQGLSGIGDVGAIGLNQSGGYLYFTMVEESGDVWLARPSVSKQ